MYVHTYVFVRGSDARCHVLCELRTSVVYNSHLPIVLGLVIQNIITLSNWFIRFHVFRAFLSIQFFIAAHAHFHSGLRFVICYCFNIIVLDTFMPVYSLDTMPILGSNKRVVPGRRSIYNIQYSRYYQYPCSGIWLLSRRYMSSVRHAHGTWFRVWVARGYCCPFCIVLRLYAQEDNDDNNSYLLVL